MVIKLSANHTLIQPNLHHAAHAVPGNAEDPVIMHQGFRREDEVVMEAVLESYVYLEVGSTIPCQRFLLEALCSPTPFSEALTLATMHRRLRPAFCATGGAELSIAFELQVITTNVAGFFINLPRALGVCRGGSKPPAVIPFHSRDEGKQGIFDIYLFT